MTAMTLSMMGRVRLSAFFRSTVKRMPDQLALAGTPIAGSQLRGHGEVAHDLRQAGVLEVIAPELAENGRAMSAQLPVSSRSRTPWHGVSVRSCGTPRASAARRHVPYWKTPA
jgi:hypothetical protein